MQPMGFYESILFVVMVLVVYGIVGGTLREILTFEGYLSRSNQNNLAIRCGTIAAWPVIVGIVVTRGLYVYTLRLYAEARKLIPRKRVAEPPKQVTVEMLAAERGSEYVPGQWANDV